VDITDNVKRIKQEIENAALKAGRTGADITLVAATKTNPPEKIREAIKAGIRDCGENRVQELLEKLPLGAYEGSRLHFIGHLQRNKVKQLVGAVSLIQSVDSEELISAIAARAGTLGIVQSVLLEVNIGREQAKSGIEPEKLPELLEVCAKSQHILVEGLMAIPPLTATPQENRHYFDQMHKLYVDIKTKKYDNINMEILSMGMSRDYEDAILAGSNMIRLGTAIFGPRLAI
jgi:pyridoxal phosphate enzyme (YggS family)